MVSYAMRMETLNRREMIEIEKILSPPNACAMQSSCQGPRCQVRMTPVVLWPDDKR